MKIFYCSKTLRKPLCGILILLLIGWEEGQAQVINPYSAGYFQNRYLFNPAMAGLSADVMDIQAGYRKEWLSVPGGPQNQYLTAEYGITDRVGMGLNLYNDKTSLFRTNRLMVTYTYHTPLDDDNKKLLFGLSAGVGRVRLDYTSIAGDMDDLAVSKFNDKGAQLDADMGFAYTDGKLTVEAAFPGLVSHLKGDRDFILDKTTLLGSVGYVFSINEESSKIDIEPKVLYRNLVDSKDLFSAGANFDFLDHLFNIFGLYHSTQNTTFGFGLNIKESYKINAIYTMEAVALKQYTKGAFEIGLGYTFGKN